MNDDTKELARQTLEMAKPLEAKIQSWTGDSASLGEALEQIRTARAACKEELERATKPLERSLAVIRSWWKPALDSLDRALSAGKFVLEQRGETPVGTTVRKETSWRIVNLAAIPTEYWLLDEKRISREIRAGKQIPGTEPVVREKVVFSRRY